MKQNTILTKKTKLSHFTNSLSIKNLKELFVLIISKLISDGGDFPRVNEITLFNIMYRRQLYFYDSDQARDIMVAIVLFPYL